VNVPAFVPGLELAAATYHEAVRPVLDDAFPGLAHSAALLGPGSEVPGFDTARSTDHDWGPRVQVFLGPADAGRATEITDTLAVRMPRAVRGWGVGSGVEVLDFGVWLRVRIGTDPRTGMRARDWLAVPTQLLLEVTAGAVFHDGLGELAPVRAALSWYPDDVWRYVLACQWHRIAQEEAFPGRCAETGDDLGSRVVTARLVRDLMRLALLMARRYPPYSKWLGTAFARLPAAAALRPMLTDAVAEAEWPQREAALCRAYGYLARAYNDLGLAEPVEPTVRLYYDRPFLVLGADRYADATRRAITDPEVSGLRPHIGAVDQFVDSADVLGAADRARAAATALHCGQT
jgi:hypothetical protein